MLITLNIPSTKLLQHHCTTNNFVQLIVLLQVCLYLGTHLIKFGFVSVLIVDQVLEDEHLVVIYLVQRHLSVVLDHQAHVFPYLLQPCLHALGNFLKLKYD